MLFTHLKLFFLWFHSAFNFRTFICHLRRASPMSIRNNARSLQPLTFNSFYAFINCLQDAQGHCCGHYLHWQAAVWEKHQDASKHRGMDSIKRLKKLQNISILTFFCRGLDKKVNSGTWFGLSMPWCCFVIECALWC